MFVVIREVNIRSFVGSFYSVFWREGGSLEEGEIRGFFWELSWGGWWCLG